MTSSVYGKRSDRCAIPREVREALGLEGGDLILWQIIGSREVHLRKAVFVREDGEIIVARAPAAGYYQSQYWCSKCQKWILHEEAATGQNGAKRCPDCNILLRLKPR